MGVIKLIVNLWWQLIYGGSHIFVLLGRTLCKAMLCIKDQPTPLKLYKKIYGNFLWVQLSQKYWVTVYF